MRWWGWMGVAIPCIIVILMIVDEARHPMDPDHRNFQMGDWILFISLWMLALMLYWSAWQ